MERSFKLAKLSSLGEAVAAVNRTIFSGLEGNLAGSSALGANSVEHFAGNSAVVAASGCLAGIAACLAALRLIGEAFFSVESLFICNKYKFGSAVFASESFVVVHLNTSNLKSDSALLRNTIN